MAWQVVQRGDKNPLITLLQSDEYLLQYLTPTEIEQLFASFNLYGDRSCCMPGAFIPHPSANCLIQLIKRIALKKLKNSFDFDKMLSRQAANLLVK